MLVHRLLAVVLQVCVPPLDLGIHAVPRMSDENCVDHAGANEVTKESELQILWGGYPPGRTVHERVSEELEGPDDAADSGADHHDQFVLVKVQPQARATDDFPLEQENGVGCQGGGQPIVPRRRAHLPRARLLHVPFAGKAKGTPRLYHVLHWALCPMWATVVFFPRVVDARSRARNAGRPWGR